MTEIKEKIYSFLFQEKTIYPLIVFRIVFGVLLLLSTIRFWSNGWIEEQYIQPNFYFTYAGFDWVHPMSDTFLYALFFIVAVSALFIALGLFYRIACVLFFLSFTYIELLDKTNYLNHYYFISLIAFLLIFLPAKRNFSLDTQWFTIKKRVNIPYWPIFILQFQIAVLYFFAGFAKLNYDWLIEAKPLSIWLPAKAGLPILGSLMDVKITAYIFSWCGALFDLSIGFLLFTKKFRKYAYGLVVVFHLATWLLFPIGMFPFFMIGLTLIFFNHNYLARWISVGSNTAIISKRKWLSVTILTYIFIQLAVPLRFLLYPGNIFWYEEAYRFSWRVMLMEKAGYISFLVKDANDEHIFEEVSTCNYLTPNQEKMMATQPDMILQFSKFLKEVYKNRGIEKPEIYAHSFVTLNGKGSKPFVNPKINLVEVIEAKMPRKNWILSYPY